MKTIYIVSLVISSIACVTDLRSRRIPNVLTFGAALGAFAFHAAISGWSGVMTAGAGWLVGLALFLLPFALRGLGGGDLKLVAALGAWLGAATVLWLAAYTAVAGAVLAVVVALARGDLRESLTNIRLLLTTWAVVGIRPVHEVSLEGSRGPRLAYAVPILVGTVVTAWRG
jgi:prepilin peptidase CpaA